MIFRPELAVAILRGKKTATRRALSDNPRSPWWRESSTYTVGQVFAVQPGRGVPRVTDAKVLAVSIDPLHALTPADARAEGFPTRNAFIDAWRSINGSWDPDQRVHVITFELVGEKCSWCQDGVRSAAGNFMGHDCSYCHATGRALSPAARELLAEHAR